MGRGYYENFKNFMIDVGSDRIFLLNKNPKSSTEDETNYEQVVIKEIIEIPNDILLGLSTFYRYEQAYIPGYAVERQRISDTITYYKLSEIRLSYKKRR